MMMGLRGSDMRAFLSGFVSFVLKIYRALAFYFPCVSVAGSAVFSLLRFRAHQGSRYVHHARLSEGFDPAGGEADPLRFQGRDPAEPVRERHRAQHDLHLARVRSIDAGERAGQAGGPGLGLHERA